jgi:hypothetical protein
MRAEPAASVLRRPVLPGGDCLHLATLLQMLLEKLHRTFQFIHVFRVVWYLAGIDVGDCLLAEIRYAAYSVARQDRKQFAAV